MYVCIDISNLPASLIGEVVTHGSHVVANGCPFCAAYYSDIFNGENSEEEILVGSVIPILVHLGSIVCLPRYVCIYVCMYLVWF